MSRQNQWIVGINAVWAAVEHDAGNVRAVERYIQEELSRRFPGIKFCVYDTSDPAVPDGRKVTVSGQLDFGF